MNTFTRKTLLPVICLFWLSASVAACEQRMPEQRALPPVVTEQRETNISPEGNCYYNAACTGVPINPRMSREKCWEQRGNSWLPPGEKAEKCQSHH